MALVRCPQCGRVADGNVCFACGHEWGESGPAPTPPPRSATAVTSAPSSVPTVTPPPMKLDVAAEPSGLTAELGIVPPPREVDEDFDPFAGPGSIPSWVDEEPVQEEEPGPLVLDTPAEVPGAAPVDLEAPLASPPLNLELEPPPSTADIAQIADGLDFEGFGDTEATELLERHPSTPALSADFGQEATVRQTTPLPNAAATSTQSSFAEEQQTDTGLDGDADAPAPSDLFGDFASGGSLEPTERIEDTDAAHTGTVDLDDDDLLSMSAEELSALGGQDDTPVLLDEADPGLGFDDELTERAEALPAAPANIDHSITDSFDASIDSDLKAFLEEDGGLSDAGASVPSPPALDEADFGDLLSGEGAPPPSPHEESFAGLLAESDAPAPPAEADFSELLGEEDASASPSPDAPGGGFGGLLATGAAPLGSEDVPAPPAEDDFTGLVDAALGSDTSSTPVPSETIGDFGGATDESFRDLFSDEQIADIGLRPLNPDPILEPDRPRAPIKGSVRNPRAAAQATDDPLAPESDFAPPTIVATLPGMIPGASPEADNAEITQQGEEPVDDEFAEATERFTAPESVTGMSEELVLDDVVESELPGVPEPPPMDLFGPPLTDAEAADALVSAKMPEPAPSGGPMPVTGVNAMDDLGGLEDLDDLADLDDLDDVDALLASEGLLDDEFLPPPSPASAAPTGRAAELASQLSTLAETLESEGRLSEAAVLYEVQAFLNSLS